MLHHGIVCIPRSILRKNKNMEGGTIMGRDNHKGASNNTNSLPQTPKNQKIKPGDMKEEMSKELAELTKLVSKKDKFNAKKRKK